MLSAVVAKNIYKEPTPRYLLDTDVVQLVLPGNGTPLVHLVVRGALVHLKIIIELFTVAGTVQVQVQVQVRIPRIY